MKPACMGCGRRTAMPNCHDTCEEYQEYVRQRKARREAGEERRIIRDYVMESIERMRKERRGHKSRERRRGG